MDNYLNFQNSSREIDWDISKSLIEKYFYHYRIRVKLGDAKRSDPAQEIYASKVIVHEEYESHPKWTNDIALIKLSEQYKSGGNVFDLAIFVSKTSLKNELGI